MTFCGPDSHMVMSQLEAAIRAGKRCLVCSNSADIASKIQEAASAWSTTGGLPCVVASPRTDSLLPKWAHTDFLSFGHAIRAGVDYDQSPRPFDVAFVIIARDDNRPSRDFLQLLGHIRAPLLLHVAFIESLPPQIMLSLRRAQLVSNKAT